MAKKEKEVDKTTIHYKGGKALLEKYGKDHFRDMVNKRWAKKRAENKTK